MAGLSGAGSGISLEISAISFIPVSIRRVLSAIDSKDTISRKGTDIGLFPDKAVYVLVVGDI